jgi:hypothetical protein
MYQLNECNGRINYFAMDIAGRRREPKKEVVKPKWKNVRVGC